MPRTLALVALLLLPFCTTTAPVRDTPHDAVQRFVTAFNNLSAEELRPLFGEDATAFLPMPDHAARITGRDQMLAVLAPLLEADRVRREGKPLTLAAQDLAIQRSGNAAIATFDVGTEQVHSRRTLVLEMRRGQWLIVHLHASNLRL